MSFKNSQLTVFVPLLFTLTSDNDLKQTSNSGFQMVFSFSILSQCFIGKLKVNLDSILTCFFLLD